MEAPRWRLRNEHYLNIVALPDGTKIEWEHKETDRTTGRTMRKMYAVPYLLDAETIVAHAVDGTRNERDDTIFLGDPTPEMEPLNEAAEAITERLRPKWEHPIESLPANGGMNDREMAFFKQMMESFGGGAAAPNQSVPKADYDELKGRLAKLEAAIAAQAKPTEAPARRV